MRVLGPEVGLGVTDFFVVSVGRFAAVDADLVVIVVDSLVEDVVGVEVTLCPRLCYKKSNYFLSSRPALCCSPFRPCRSINYRSARVQVVQFVRIISNYSPQLRMTCYDYGRYRGESSTSGHFTVTWTSLDKIKFEKFDSQCTSTDFDPKKRPNPKSLSHCCQHYHMYSYQIFYFQ